MYTVKFETFFLIKFKKNRTCSYSSNWFDERDSIKIFKISKN